MKFDEEKLEAAIIELLRREDYTHLKGEIICREPSEFLIKEDLISFLI